MLTTFMLDLNMQYGTFENYCYSVGHEQPLQGLSYIMVYDDITYSI